MANYNLVTTSTFQPFSYEELSAPIIAREKEHEAADLAALTLQEQIASLAGEDLGDELNIKYNNFKNRLNNVNQRLSSTGISPELSRELNMLRRQYASDILPMVQAASDINAARVSRDAATSANPNIHYKFDLPSIEEKLAGDKINQGFWDFGKIDDSVATIATPIITNYLAEEDALRSKNSAGYNILMSNVKDRISEVMGNNIPSNYAVDNIIREVFNAAYDAEDIARTKKNISNLEIAKKRHDIYNLPYSDRNNKKSYTLDLWIRDDKVGGPKLNDDVYEEYIGETPELEGNDKVYTFKHQGDADEFFARKEKELGKKFYALKYLPVGSGGVVLNTKVYQMAENSDALVPKSSMASLIEKGEIELDKEKNRLRVLQLKEKDLPFYINRASNGSILRVDNAGKGNLTNVESIQVEEKNETKNGITLNSKFNLSSWPEIDMSNISDLDAPSKVKEQLEIYIARGYKVHVNKNINPDKIYIYFK